MAHEGDKIGSHFRKAREVRLLPSAGMQIAIVGALAAAGLIFIATWRHGPGTSPDATTYLAAARAIAGGQAPIMFYGAPMTWWPPFYPAVIAGFSIFTGLDVVQAAVVTNAICFAAFVGTMSLLTYRLSDRNLALTVVVTSLLLVGTLPAVYRFAFSEALYLALYAAFLFAGDLLISGENRRRAMIVLCAVAAMAPVTRYIGVSVIVSGILLILFYSNGTSFFARALHATIWGALASVPFAILVTYNWLVAGQPMGPRLPAELSVVEVVQSCADGLAKYILPQLPRGLPTLCFLIVVLALMVASLSVRRTAPAAILGLTGLVLTVLAAARTHLFGIESRLLLPTIPSLIAIAVALIAFSEQLLGRAVRPAAKWFFVGMIGVLVVTSIPREVPRVQRASEGIGYTSSRWRDSATLRCADRLPEDADLYTNFPELFYLHRNQRVVPFSPSKNGSAFARYTGWDVNWWLMRLAANTNPKYVVWFRRGTDSDSLRPSEMRKLVPLALIEECGDGAIYKMQR